MMNTQQRINRFFLLATAPFLGMMIWMLTIQIDQLMPSLASLGEPVQATFSLTEKTTDMDAQLVKAAGDVASIQTTIEKYYDLYAQSSADVSVMLQSAEAQASRPAQIFDNRIAAAFGQPTRQSSSGSIDLKLYSFSEKNYKGYALKAVLKSDKAMQMILGKDKIGSAGETTLSAVNRYGAVAGVNAGGFADDGGGRRYPTGTTMYNGKYVYGFFPSQNDMAFVGMNKDRKLIGGKFYKQEELDELNPVFGASFVPVLLKDGRKQEIPVKWMTSPYRAPRTVVGSFRNGQILFLVTDGYDEKGGSGASLAELQDKLQSLGIRDAYNLDGGGSSTLVWGGEVINNPSDGRMRNMPTHFLFFK